MSYANPILSTGRVSNQAFQKVSTAQLHEVGTRGYLPDGRVFYYSSNVSTALAPGKTVVAGTYPTYGVNIAVASDTAISSRLLPVTLGSSQTLAANLFAGGYVTVNAGTGLGYIYKIRSHAAVAASTAMTLDLWDPITVAVTAASSKVTFSKNPWAEVAIGGATGQIVGVTPTDVPLGSTTTQYFWSQTWGLCPLLSDATVTTAVGQMVIPAASGAGTLDLAASVVSQIGTAPTVSVSAEYRPVFLTICP